MAKRKLEEIAFKDGEFVKVSDRTQVTPVPVGNPIPGVITDPRKSREFYNWAVIGAQEQGLWNLANAYSKTYARRRKVDPEFKGLSFVVGTVAIQLYKI